MGVWGAGNFQRDDALDYMGRVTDWLCERIEETLADEDSSMLDEEGEAVVPPSVRILTLLSQECNSAPPKTQTVEGWKAQFLAI